LYQLARAIYRFKEKPYLVGSLAELLGYVVSGVRDRSPALDRATVQFLRSEQLSKLVQPGGAWDHRQGS
jgi:hypothetical protein